MSIPQSQSSSRWYSSRKFFLVVLLIGVTGLSAAALLVPLPTAPNAVPLALGDVSTQDILAPVNITYQSEVLTEKERQLAADAVEPAYAAQDTSIARSQVNQLRSAINFITIVRADEYAAPEQKAADLAALQNINLKQNDINQILGLADVEWQNIQQEAITVLEQVMRSTIREDRLEDTRRSIPALVSLSLSEDHAALVVDLVSAFVAPNSLFSVDLTESRRQAARDAVEPVIRSFVANEVVITRGHVVTEADLEALEKMGLLQPETTWEDRVSVFSLVAVNLGFVGLYFWSRPDLHRDNRSLLIISVLFIVFLFGVRLVIPNRTVIPYLFPIAGFGLLVASLISNRVAMILSVPISILAAYGLPNSFELSLFYLFGSVIGILVLGNAQRIMAYFWAGLAVLAAGAAVIMAFRLTDPTTDAIGFLSLIAASAFNGLAAAGLTIVLQYFLAQILGLTTTIQLIETSRPDHPLLQFMLRNVPGTYQHSLQIANLAEQAAESIGADGLLTRVGALYHDAGKARYPHFYIENQAPGSQNPHDSLAPLESSTIIVKHVLDGVDLAKKYRLPKRITDFILEHHGTLITRYQYHKAVDAAGGDAQKVDREAFRYPGPKPQSRETGLVMLADGVEARARAERPTTAEDIRKLIREIIDQRLSQGQLDDTPLTLKDLSLIVDSFATTLKGTYHPRIQYPKTDQDTTPRDEIPSSTES